MVRTSARASKKVKTDLVVLQIGDQPNTYKVLSEFSIFVYIKQSIAMSKPSTFLSVRHNNKFAFIGTADVRGKEVI